MKLIDHRELPERKGIRLCNVHRLRLEAQGKFPRRIKTSDTKNARVFYDEDEIDGWIKSRANARDV